MRLIIKQMSRTQKHTTNSLVATKHILGIPILIAAILLWFYVLSDIQASTTLWIIFIAWLVMVILYSIVGIGVDKLLIETTVEQSVLKWFAKNGYGSQIGQ